MFAFVSAGQKRDRKPVDYTFAAYEASIEGKGVLARGAALLSPPSHPETQRHDRSERLRARQAKKVCPLELFEVQSQECTSGHVPLGNRRVRAVRKNWISSPIAATESNEASSD